MNKCLLIIPVVFFIINSSSIAGNRLKEYLVVKGNVPMFSLIEGEQAVLLVRNNKIYRWDKSKNAITDSIDFHISSKITAFDFCRKTQLIAVGFQSGELFLTDLKGRLRMVLTKTTMPLSVKFSDDGNLLAAGTSDCYLSIWNTLNQQLLWKNKGHNDHILSIGFGKNDSILYTGSADKRIGIWNAQKGIISGYLNDTHAWVRKLVISKDKNDLYAITDKGTVFCWTIMKEGPIFNKKIKSTYSWGLSLTVKEENIASGFKNGLFVFHTKFATYRHAFNHPVIDLDYIEDKGFIIFFISVMNKGLYMVDLKDKSIDLAPE